MRGAPTLAAAGAAALAAVGAYVSGGSVAVAQTQYRNQSVLQSPALPAPIPLLPPRAPQPQLPPQNQPQGPAPYPPAQYPSAQYPPAQYPPGQYMPPAQPYAPPAQGYAPAQPPYAPAPAYAPAQPSIQPYAPAPAAPPAQQDLLQPAPAPEPAPSAPAPEQATPSAPSNAPSAPPSPPEAAPPVQSGWVPKQVAELRALDKVDATVTPITIRVGQSVQYKSLTIALRACDARPPDQPADSTAFLDISDSRPGAPGFHGWVFAHDPSVSMLQHPVYSVQLASCQDGQAPAQAASSGKAGGRQDAQP